jgi:hypothetical protein
VKITNVRRIEIDLKREESRREGEKDRRKRYTEESILRFDQDFFIGFQVDKISFKKSEHKKDTLHVAHCTKYWTRNYHGYFVWNKPTQLLYF